MKRKPGCHDVSGWAGLGAAEALLHCITSDSAEAKLIAKMQTNEFDLCAFRPTPPLLFLREREENRPKERRGYRRRPEKIPSKLRLKICMCESVCRVCEENVQE